MPEGDTVWLTAHRLDQALRGRPLTTFDLRVPSMALADRRGDTITEVLSRGKHLLARLDSGLTLHSHLKMDGSWRITRSAAGPRGRPPFQIRALLGNAEWLAAGYRVHELRLVHTVDEHLLVGHLGPDLLGSDWNPEKARERLLREPERPIGEALLDQRNLAGIGNMYKAEILFVERVNPWAPTGAVADLSTMTTTAYRLLRANRDHPEQSTTGLTGRGQEHWVYGRGGQPCRRCGSPIRSAEQGTPPQQRITYWCPTCQPTAEAPTPGGLS
ncbi:MAG: Fpg/Nei family DNA glycosylase [Actinobacteria bacterium]|nr:Fpg/Nei family DNA glycosylase [Actinomycetota bacterium]